MPKPDGSFGIPAHMTDTALANLNFHQFNANFD